MADGLAGVDFLVGDGNIKSRTTKAQRRAARRANRQTEREAETKVKPISALNEVQRDYMEALKESDQVFAIGSAGGGKTFIAAHHAATRLTNGDVSKAIIARPAVSKKKHQLGFLPGTNDEKLLPWLEPVLDGFRAAISPIAVERLRKEHKISFLAFEHMLGRTFNDAVVILDEAQNCDLSDLKVFLTRMGKNSQVIVCGDPSMPVIEDSGLETVLEMVEKYNLPVEVIEFGPEDVVRSAGAAAWVDAFDREV
jgi:phosphate starvation-inducible protein PhoH and related proteins